MGGGFEENLCVATTAMVDGWIVRLAFGGRTYVLGDFGLEVENIYPKI